MTRRHPRKARFKLRSFYLWHRYMGVSAALFALLLAVTGVLLNHTEQFQFDSRYVRSDWVLNWYGIEAPEHLTSFPVGSRSATLMGEHLYLDRREIEGEYRDLIGVVALMDMFVVAVSDGLVLLTSRGEVIERLQGKDGVPAGMRRIGTSGDGALVVEGGHGLYRTDSDLVRWEPVSREATVHWSTTGALDKRLKRSLQQHYRGEVLPLERVLLDLHSGRFFGRYGPWIMDAAALLISLLAVTGVWMWVRRRR